MPVSSRGNSEKAKTPLSLVFGDNGKSGGFVVDAKSLVGHAVCVGGEFENSGWLSSLGKQALSQGYPVTWFGAPGLVSVGDEIHRAALEAGFGEKIQRISFDAADSRTSMKSFSLNKDISLPSDTLSNMLADILMGSWDYPDGHSMWLGRSISMIMPVAHALCWKRDELGIPFDFDDLADSTEFEQYENIARDPTIPAYLANKMNGYLTSLPGYKLGSEVPSVHAVENHGYLSMQYQCLLKKLSGLLNHETGAERIDWGELEGKTALSFSTFQNADLTQTVQRWSASSRSWHGIARKIPCAGNRNAQWTMDMVPYRRMRHGNLAEN